MALTAANMPQWKNFAINTASHTIKQPATQVFTQTVPKKIVASSFMKPVSRCVKLIA
jgi:hypothetical protein